jgi:hypothetical protein
VSKKLEQFYIFKIDSDRLKEHKYKIANLTIEQARLNGELVSISNSQLVRTIHLLTGKNVSSMQVRDLHEQKKRITRKKNNVYNRKKLQELIEQIDSLLFVPEIISVRFVNKTHYSKILERGFFSVNGKHYVPFMASSGMIRRNTALFIEEAIKSEITVIFENGKSKALEISPAKYSAYYALYSSSSMEVTFPKIAIIPDLLIKTKRDVEYTAYVGDGIDPLVEQRNMELECNAFDGQGLVSPDMAKRWSQDLELDYLPSAFIVRAPFLKGLCVVFDFHKLAKETEKETIVDIYGNAVDVYDVDVLISESQFKLWNAYGSTQEYYDNCVRNELGWGISRTSPKADKTYAMSSYQFLQVLDLIDNDVARLCEPTIHWLKQVSGGELLPTLLYLMGDIEYSEGWFEQLDSITQALLLNEEMLKDSYVQALLDKSLVRKKRDAMMGRLVFSGNYSFAISEPYMQACHALGLYPHSLLQENTHYSNFWNTRKQHIPYATAIRSPIVHHSEINTLHFARGTALDTWYKYIYSGIVFPPNGIGMDFAINGGMDVDGDLICTVDHPSFVFGKQLGLPIVYDTQKASKIILEGNEDEVYKSVTTGFGTKVGFYTNVSTAYYALLANFGESSAEAKTIQQRLKYGRTLQGLEIDKQKGLVIPPFPEHWTKWKKITEEMTEEEVQQHKFNNNILADKRPYFMRWLYSGYNNRYLKEIAAYNNICYTKWGISFEELVAQDVKTQEQQDLMERYNRRTFFINNNSTMNRISRYMEKELKKVKLKNRASANDFDFTILVSQKFRTPSSVNLDKMLLLYKHWKSLRRSLTNKTNADENDFVELDQIDAYINKKAYSSISSSDSELADMAVYLCYVMLGKTSKMFCWRVFGKEVVSNMLSKYDKKYVRAPKKSVHGSQEYLWSTYGMYNINIEE